MDIRQNGRWGVGAELLMRRGVESSKSQRPRLNGSEDGMQSSDEGGEAHDSGESAFSDEGFRLARRYYERLILQYPHTPYSQHDVNALVLYPALFNIWIYEVQSRSRRSQQPPSADRPTSSAGSETSDVRSSPSATGTSARRNRELETEQALQIAQRMDEVMQGPPYDASVQLLRLRGMLGLWLSDLLSRPKDLDSEEDGGDSPGRLDINVSAHDRRQAAAEREKALSLLKKVKAQGEDLPVSIVDMLQHEGDALSDE